MADLASARSPDGAATRSAASENVTTPTRSPAGTRPTAAFASCLARANWPDADMLYEVSRAITVAPLEPTASPEAKNGRANAIASRTSVAIRSASSSSSRNRCLAECSTGACFNSLTAANFTLGSGSRFSRCSTIGIAAAAAPARNRGERNDSPNTQRALSRVDK